MSHHYISSVNLAECVVGQFHKHIHTLFTTMKDFESQLF